MSYKSMMNYKADKRSFENAMKSNPIGVCSLHADMTGLRPLMIPSARQLRCKYCKEWATEIVDENTPANEIYDD